MIFSVLLILKLTDAFSRMTRTLFCQAMVSITCKETVIVGQVNNVENQTTTK
jgi:hypothetical protein